MLGLAAKFLALAKMGRRQFPRLSQAVVLTFTAAAFTGILVKK